jgi:hypothetical protein
MCRARAGALGFALLAGMLTAPTAALADEGGVSFWIPGFFGSLAAAPLQPGFAITTIDYYDSVKAGGDIPLPATSQFEGSPRISTSESMPISMHALISAS